MELERSESGARLLVGRVDEDPRRRTPASRWNLDERRRSVKPGRTLQDEDEVKPPLDLRPGDRIAAVNGWSDPSAMVAELARAMDVLSPKAVRLSVSRDQRFEPVLHPAPSTRSSMDARRSLTAARAGSRLGAAGALLAASTSSSSASSPPSSRDEGSVSSGDSTCASVTVESAAQRLRYHKAS